MRSVRRVSAAFAATLPVAAMCTGCVSTQTVAARDRLVDARIRAGEKPTVVTRADPVVNVGAPVVIRGRRGVSAIVVALRNDSSRTLTDLPISVGVRRRSGRNVYLNASATADYFQSHVASIAAHGAAMWVFTTGRRLPSGRVFAVVGAPALQTSAAGSLPRVIASPGSEGSGAVVTVTVRSHSAIPQYDLPLYVLAVRGGHFVAAGQATLAHLGTHGATTVGVRLIGNRGDARLQVIALPTIFS